MFKKATRFKSKLRMGLIGPSGAGKTYSSLKIAQALGKKIAVIDTEHGSASKYSHLCEFAVLELDSFSPQTYITAIENADKEGFEVLIIDSLSHAWMGKDGALEMVDNIAKRTQSQNSFTAWREVTPHHNRLVEAMLKTNCHLIVTLRAKTEYIIEANSKGKMAPRKVGLAAIQREGLEYEFDVVGDIDLDKNLIINKTRCETLDGALINKPSIEFGKTLLTWVTEGEDVPPPPPPPKFMSKEQLVLILELFGHLVSNKFDCPSEEAKEWRFVTNVVSSRPTDLLEDKALNMIAWLNIKKQNLDKEIADKKQAIAEAAAKEKEIADKALNKFATRTNPASQDNAS